VHETRHVLVGRYGDGMAANDDLSDGESSGVCEGFAEERTMAAEDHARRTMAEETGEVVEGSVVVAAKRTAKLAGTQREVDDARHGGRL